MGTWNTAIFGSDTACDVRDEFRIQIGLGKTPAQATREVRKQITPGRDRLEQTEFWLALAAVQWKTGRLLPEVKMRALTLIQRGADLREWQRENPKLLGRRRTAIQTLRRQLLSPPPLPSRIPPPSSDQSDWEVGHAVAYRLRSGRYVIFRVVYLDEERFSRTPVVEICDWVGKRIPDRAAIRRLRVSTEPDDLSTDGGLRRVQWALYSRRRKDYPADRLIIVATGLSVRRAENSNGTWYFGGWANLDSELRHNFGLR